MNPLDAISSAIDTVIAKLEDGIDAASDWFDRLDAACDKAIEYLDEKLEELDSHDQ